jgi:hypothetical protein
MNKLRRVHALSLMSTLLLQAWPVLAASPGSTKLLVSVGDVAPGVDGQATFASFDFGLRYAPDGRQVIYSAQLAGKNITSANREGFWQGGSLLARTGDVAPGAGGAVFSNLDFGAASGGALYVGFLGGAGVDASNNVGLWSGQQMVMRTGDAAPVAGGKFTNLGSSVTNAKGQTAYRALTTEAGGGGIWLDQKLVALSSLVAPGLGGVTYQTVNINSGALSNTGQVAYSATLSDGTRSVWRDSQLLARTGDAAPGASGATFSDVASPKTNAQGRVAYTGSLTGSGVTAANANGIWVERQLVVRSGDAVTPDGLAVQRQVRAFIGLSDRGQVAYSAALDGTVTNSLWRDQTLVARQGQSLAAVGLPQLTLDSSTFGATLAAGGQLLFESGLSGAGVDSSNREALFIGDGQDLVMVARAGETLPDGTRYFSFGSSVINAQGQVSYVAEVQRGTGHALLTYTPALRWRSNNGGSWSEAANWTLGLDPADMHDVTLDPSNSLSVSGPTGTVAVKSLQVGTGSGIATLAMAGGRIDAESVRIGAQGVLSGTGSFGSFVHNQGVLQVERLQISGGLDNAGTVRGATGIGSRLETNLNNTSAGRVRVGSGETLQLLGKNHQNVGVVEVNGGRLEISGSFVNAKAGTVDLKNASVVADGAWRNDTGGRVLMGEARLSTSAGFSNAGQVQITSGSSEFFGAVHNEKGGQIIVSGQGTTTFYDAVEVQSGAELRVSGGATAVFFGAVQQRSGAVFSGSGQKYYEGGFSVGNSPGAASDAGDVAFGLGNLYLAELGGTAPGTGHDFYDVAGTLTLGGTLQIVSWDGFTGQAGQSFDLFDWGQLQGAFGAIDSSGLLLTEGTRLDLSRLYLDGTVSVTAVPEPGTWALWLGGLLALGRRVQRRATS